VGVEIAWRCKILLGCGLAVLSGTLVVRDVRSELRRREEIGSR